MELLTQGVPRTEAPRLSHYRGRILYPMKNTERVIGRHKLETSCFDPFLIGFSRCILMVVFFMKFGVAIILTAPLIFSPCDVGPPEFYT